MSSISGPGGKPLDPGRFLASRGADKADAGPTQPSVPDTSGTVKPTEDHFEMAQTNVMAQLMGASPGAMPASGSGPTGTVTGMANQLPRDLIGEASFSMQQGPIPIVAMPNDAGEIGQQGPMYVMAKPPGTDQGPIFIVAKPPSGQQGDGDQSPIYIIARPGTSKG